MSFGFGFALPHWQTLSGGFSPASLFAAGEVGAWYDPSDLTTLFTTSAGTTPVTAVEQSVGLMLDKSKGLALGSELVTNGDFSSGTTGWTGFAATLAVNSGRLQVTPTDAVTGSRAGYQNLTTVIGGVYRVQCNYDQGTANSVQLMVRDAAPNGTIIFDSGAKTATGTASGQFVATSTTSVICLVANGNGLNGFFDNASVKNIAGNHAYQSTSADRPVLRALYNLLTYTEQFDNNAAWTRGNATPANTTATTDPLGGTTAELLYPNTTGTFRWVYQTGATGVNLLTWSIYAKAQNKSIIYTDPTGGGTALTYFNLATGQPGITASGYTASMLPVGNGWYRCTLTNNSAAASSFLSVWGVADANGSTTATANGTDGIYIWGAQTIVTNSLPSNQYQRVVTNTLGSGVYDSAGFLPYLAFNGTNTSMLTNSVDFATVTSDGQARRNVLNNPTQFNVTASWTLSGGSITADAIAAPDGTVTADLLTGNGTTFVSVKQTAGVTGTATGSFYVKANTETKCEIWPDFGSSLARFDLSAVTATNTGGSNAAITPLANGWFRISVQSTTFTNNLRLILGYAAPTLSTSMYVWGAQLEAGSITAFQNIGTDKMTVWAGVRKLSDAATAILTELSADSNSNAGSFTVVAPNGAAANYAWLSRGSLTPGAITVTTYAAPITNVLTGIGDIAGDQEIIRANGSQVGINTSDQGTGNYGTYPIYIGRRNNATLPFNGWLTSLIIRGAQSTASQISATEAWVNQRTGAY